MLIMLTLLLTLNAHNAHIVAHLALDVHNALSTPLHSDTGSPVEEWTLLEQASLLFHMSAVDELSEG